MALRGSRNNVRDDGLVASAVDWASSPRLVESRPGLSVRDHLDGLLGFRRLQLDQSPLQMKNKLREMRATKEWSQSDLAEKLEVSRQTVNAIETGRYDPSLPLAFKLAGVFKVAIEDIFVPDKD